MFQSDTRKGIDNSTSLRGDGNYSNENGKLCDQSCDNFSEVFRQIVPSSNASGRLKSFTACLCGESGRRYTVLAGNRVKATHVGLWTLFDDHHPSQKKLKSSKLYACAERAT